MGGGGGGVVSTRSAATALGKLTWGFAIAFIATSLTLTILAAQNSADTSVIDQLGVPAPSQSPTDAPLGTDLLPPSLGDTPLTPPPVD